MRQRTGENIRTLRHDAMMKVIARDDLGLRDVIDCHGLNCNFVVQGRHVLSLACASSSVEVVRELLAGGALVPGSSAPGARPQQDDPLLVVVRLNRQDVFEELLKKVQNVACVVPWTCLTERRYAMLDVLLQRGFCHDFLRLMTLDFWGAPQCRFIRRYLPVLVSSNVFLDNWEITTEAVPSFAFTLPLSAVPLLLNAQARLRKIRISSTENHSALSILNSPQTLQDLARSVLRTNLVQRKMYEQLTNIFFPVGGKDRSADFFFDGDGQRLLENTVRKFQSLPRSMLDILFLVNEKKEFLKSVNIDNDLPCIWLSLVVDN